MVHYAVGVNGLVVDARSSKSHATKIYNYAVVSERADGTFGVLSYHGTEALAESTRRTWAPRLPNTKLWVQAVMTTERRAKVGTPVLELQTVAL